MLDQLSAGSAERNRLQRMFEQAPGFMALLEGPDHRFAMVNPAFLDLFGHRELLGKTVSEALPELAEQGIVEMLDNASASGEPFVGRAMPVQVRRALGTTEEIFVDFVFQPMVDDDDQPTGMFVLGHDVTEHQRGELLRQAHNNVLALAVADRPLEETLGALIKIVESTSKTGVLGSILLLDCDGIHLRHGAAPSLPPEYMAVINGAEIGPCAGSCGTAAFTGEPVFVSDIESDPLWADFKGLALPHGLRACWSIPILAAGHKVLGTFAMYHREPREPTVRDLTLVDLITQTAALVIDRERSRTALREIEEVSGLCWTYP